MFPPPKRFVWQRSKYTSGNGRPQAKFACGLPFPEVYLERCQTSKLLISSKKLWK